jgi:hypothetical protein
MVMLVLEGMSPCRGGIRLSSVVGRSSCSKLEGASPGVAHDLRPWTQTLCNWRNQALIGGPLALERGGGRRSVKL